MFLFTDINDIDDDKDDDDYSNDDDDDDNDHDDNDGYVWDKVRGKLVFRRWAFLGNAGRAYWPGIMFMETLWAG